MTMAKYLAVFILSCITVTCFGAISRHKRQAANLCPQEEGRYPVEGDCTRFMECARGNAQIKMCPMRLVFNPQTQECDRAGSVNGCQDQGHPSDSLCDRNPGRPGESWKVAHPAFCNAFYTCEEHFIHKRCEFCGEGTFFSEANGYCVGMKSEDETTVTECSQKQLVPHSQKAILELYQDCNLFQRNPFQPLITRIGAESGNNIGGVQPGNTGVVVRPLAQSRGFVWNQNQAGGGPVVLMNPLPLTVLSNPVFGKK